MFEAEKSLNFALKQSQQCAMLIKDSTQSLHGHDAVTTRSLHGHYTVTTRSLRGHYAVTVRDCKVVRAAERKSRVQFSDVRFMSMLYA